MEDLTPQKVQSPDKKPDSPLNANNAKNQNSNARHHNVLSSDSITHIIRTIAMIQYCKNALLHTNLP